MLHRLRADDAFATSAAFAFVAVVYSLLAFVWLVPGVYWSPDSGYRHLQAQNIQLSPTLDLEIRYPGRWLDPDLEFAPFPPNFSYVQDGRIHLIYSPILSIL